MVIAVVRNTMNYAVVLTDSPRRGGRAPQST